MSRDSIKKETVLIVDDNPTNLDMLINLLDQAGFEVYAAEDGESAIEQVQYTQPDIILLDIMMPGIDGYETCRLLKANSKTQDIPIIFITALSDIGDKVKGFEVGAVDYVTKPFQHSEVLARLTTQLTLRRLQKSLQVQNIQLQQEIVQRQLAEQALEQQALELKTRNEELNAFARTVAHDLQAPVALITGYADLLQQHWLTMSPTDVQEFLQTITHAGLKLSNIISSLLLLARVRKGQVEINPLNMTRIVAEMQQRLPHLIKNYEAHLSVPAAWPVGLGYGPWVEEVWMNYVTNAIKYGGRPPQVELGATPQEDGWIRFWVRDNGPGLSPEEQTRLFTEFTQLDRSRTDGNGLGLSIVKCIVEKLGGQVGVESRVGQGSTFYFTLPGATRTQLDAKIPAALFESQ
jgi:signal transduction histidine kinase